MNDKTNDRLPDRTAIASEASAPGLSPAAEGVRTLLAVMAKLRDPADGCPWDLEQNFASIAPYTIEEAYEVADAIQRGDLDDLKDELGDLLLQVVFHARMAEEAGAFDFSDVAAAIVDKMVRRHPHVFGDRAHKDVDEQVQAWEDIKAAERAAKSGPRESTGLLSGVPLGLPAATRAEKLQKRAARVGFDWPNALDVIAKVDEELAELKEEIESTDSKDRLEEEFGDLLFALVNLGRHFNLDAEQALRGANAKFTRRFAHIEEALGSRLRDADLEEMEALWQQAKALK
jgi:MazG family protein